MRKENRHVRWSLFLLLLCALVTSIGLGCGGGEGKKIISGGGPGGGGPGGGGGGDCVWDSSQWDNCNWQ